MSKPDHMIGTALRELADEASSPRLNADALWRAGRRRRWAAITTSAAGAAAAAALIPLALLGVMANPAPAPVKTHQLPLIDYPIQFRQVARITDSSCPPHSHGLPGISGDECFYFTHTGMTISSFGAVRIAEQEVTCGGTRRAHSLPASRLATSPPLPEGPGTIMLGFRLQRADIHRYAHLTEKFVHQPSPRNQLAIISNGVVIFHPHVATDMNYSNPPYLTMTASTLHSRRHPGGWMIQLGWLTRMQARVFLGHLPAPACFP
jgi:hypothetical protein